MAGTHLAFRCAWATHGGRSGRFGPGGRGALPSRPPPFPPMAPVRVSLGGGDEHVCGSNMYSLDTNPAGRGAGRQAVIRKEEEEEGPTADCLSVPVPGHQPSWADRRRVGGRPHTVGCFPRRAPSPWPSLGHGGRHSFSPTTVGTTHPHSKVRDVNRATDVGMGAGACAALALTPPPPSKGTKAPNAGRPSAADVLCRRRAS